METDIDTESKKIKAFFDKAHEYAKNLPNRYFFAKETIEVIKKASKTKKYGGFKFAKPKYTKTEEEKRQKLSEELKKWLDDNESKLSHNSI